MSHTEAGYFFPTILCLQDTETNIQLILQAFFLALILITCSNLYFYRVKRAARKDCGKYCKYLIHLLLDPESMAH